MEYKKVLKSRTGWLLGIIGATVLAVLQVLSISRSSSSTAAIGFIFVPVFSLVAFVGFFLYGFGADVLKNQVAAHTQVSWKKIIPILFVLFGVTAVFTMKLVDAVAIVDVVNDVQKMNSPTLLDQAFEKSAPEYDKFVMGALAQNPASSPDLLDKIAKLADPALHEKMGSLFPLLGSNSKGLAVMRLVARNANVRPETIEYLAATSPSEYVLSDLAANSKTSDQTLKNLEKRDNYLIDWGLAQNPHTPVEVIQRIVEKKMDFTQKTTLGLISKNDHFSDEIRNKAKALLNK